jgi:hypothetical protein
MSKSAKGKDAAKESPDIQALNELGKKLMKVPKSELEKKLDSERQSKLKSKENGQQLG